MTQMQSFELLVCFMLAVSILGVAVVLDILCIIDFIKWMIKRLKKSKEEVPMEE